MLMPQKTSSNGLVETDGGPNFLGATAVEHQRLDVERHAADATQVWAAWALLQTNFT